MMRRIGRSWIFGLLGIATLLLVHACSEDVTAPDRREPPDTRVWAGAPRGLGAEFAIDFVFTAQDTDDETASFEWRVLESPEDEAAWTRTGGGDLTLTFPMDPGELGFENPGTRRTLEVRAIDASGLVDPTPAVVDFTPLTVAPQVVLALGAEHPVSCLQVGSATTFRWTGTDPDSKSGTPASVRYLLKKYGSAGQQCLLRFEYESGEFPISTTDPLWSDWMPFEETMVDGPGVRLPVLPPSALGDSYVFAVQVRDLYGATSRSFEWGQQIAHVRVSDQKYPILTVEEPTFGTENFYGPSVFRSFEITPGQVMEFSWAADASQYLGEVEDFRYGWDIVDPDDPDDPGWSVDWGDWSEAPAQSFLTGSHNFIAQVRDRAGAITRATYHLSVGEPTGVPTLQFSVYVDVGPGGDPVWELRWIGDLSGPAPESPEQTANPFAGFGRRFKVEWEATSPNGPIVGYRYRVEQGSGEYTPPNEFGEKQWDPEATSFVFANEVSPDALGAGCDENAIGCDPAVVRFPSGTYNLAVEAIDAAQVESPPTSGLLEFSVNYPPETSLEFDQTWPRFEVRDGGGFLLTSGPVAAGDTIPAMSTVFLRSNGYDKFADELPPGAPTDSLCCDMPLDYDPLLLPGDPGYVPMVEFQSRLVTVRREGDDPTGRVLSNTFSSPDVADTISFWAGPLDYTYHSRTVDEHRRPDPNVETLEFVAGFPPRVREDLMIPGGDLPGQSGDVADTLVVSIGAQPFPENEIPYTVNFPVQKWWVPDPGSECEGLLVDYVDGDPAPEDGVLFGGAVVSVSLKFVGEPDPRDPLSPVKAWSFALFSDKDPDNLIEDGFESPDLSYFLDSPLPNEWEFGPGDALTIWVPLEVGVGSTGDFRPDSTDPVKRSVGCLVARRLGDMTLQLRGRTTALGDEYVLYSGTRKDHLEPALPVQMADFGRQSDTTEVQFWFLIGGLGEDPDVPVSYWPDF